MSYDHLQPLADSAKSSGRVGVLMGGTSAEREVSLVSGSFVLNALIAAGVDAFKVDIGESVIAQLQNLKADRVFNILHGRGGEDGEIQAILDVMKIPYVGSGVKSSAVTIDKLMTKRLLLGSGIATPDFQEITPQSDFSSLLEKIGLPMIVKPVNEGSSIGMSKVTQADELPGAYELARQFGSVMAEKWIDGAEYTVAWLGGTVLPAIKLETPHEFYDYDAKYKASDTIYTCPCGLAAEQEKILTQLTSRVVAICGLRHWGRVDLMLDRSGEFQVIEINTVPGMTDHSLVPMAALEAGLDFEKLVLKLVELSMDEEC